MSEFLLFFVIGFFAQAVDGALGMAYGVISSTVLIATGVSPAQASAAIHTAEMFTTAASGGSHLYNKNVDWKLFWRLTPFGILGGVLGAYVLTSIDATAAKPFVTTYLAIIGVYLLIRSFMKIPSKPVPASVVAPLGFVGGFLDAAGGGGWGPVVTTGLLGAGGTPRYVVGTVNAAEFLITFSVSLTFLFALVFGHWDAADGLGTMLLPVAGLIAGGVFAAPLAAIFVRHIREDWLLRIIGSLICSIATYQTVRYFV
ncbi:sulfite exporter TauE/SafE family protein [Maritalea porphyrae]|uniref:sulfite exporter TauE/SafE family protein n=1 Tax=Maritalea porphyrae TaxID=880732 RepID=UPI0022AF9B74|nr:sulfite exporter TauE/SafE family protein [Maritalea porphyrae]MCZ4273631.1 sulfite exporter TauE/SafE family protein [Maritalea porphyrae]